MSNQKSRTHLGWFSVTSPFSAVLCGIVLNLVFNHSSMKSSTQEMDFTVRMVVAGIPIAIVVLGLTSGLGAIYWSIRDRAFGQPVLGFVGALLNLGYLAFVVFTVVRVANLPPPASPENQESPTTVILIGDSLEKALSTIADQSGRQESLPPLPLPTPDDPSGRVLPVHVYRFGNRGVILNLGAESSDPSGKVIRLDSISYGDRGELSIKEVDSISLSSGEITSPHPGDESSNDVPPETPREP